jgi:adenylate cyclase
MYEVIYHWVDDREPPLQEAMQFAERAVAIDNEHPMALTALGFACSLTGLRDRALSVLERAVALNPSSALACWSLGSALASAGRPDDAIPMVEKAIRLSPQDPMMNEFLFTIGSAQFMAGRYEQAIDFARRSLDLKPEQPGGWRVLAAANALLGRMDEARRSLRELLRLTPNLTERRMGTFLGEESMTKYVDGLRKAGWTG